MSALGSLLLLLTQKEHSVEIFGTKLCICDLSSLSFSNPSCVRTLKTDTKRKTAKTSLPLIVINQCFLPEYAVTDLVDLNTNSELNILLDTFSGLKL